jgi:hypothetical protein
VGLTHHGVSKTNKNDNLLMILLPSFQGGRQTGFLNHGGSLSPSFFARSGLDRGQMDSRLY